MMVVKLQKKFFKTPEAENLIFAAETKLGKS